MHTGDHPAAARLLERLARPAVAFTASGTAALEVALEVLGVGPGDEVVVPDVGCHSIGVAVVRRGAIPVFTGVGPALVLSPAEVLVALSARTKAVVAAHHYGLPCDVHGIIEVVPPGLAVIEDIAPTWGTQTRGVLAGAAGDVAVTSFGPSKPVSLGGGGAVLGPLDLISGAVSHGDVRDRSLTTPPSSARLPTRLLDDLSAAIDTADDELAARRAAVEEFLAADLAAHFRLPPHPPESTFAWTRVPLYPVGPAAEVQVPRLRDELGQVQHMHTVPPSGLPMFQGRATRTVAGAGRPVDPILVKIG